MSRNLLLIILFAGWNSLFAQIECGYMTDYLYKLKTIPDYAKKLQAFEDQIKIAIEKSKLALLNEEPPVLTIPVVFHIVWKTEEQKLPESTIRIQLARLNEDFNNMNYDLKFVPDAFKPFIGNMRIKFLLAQTDPNNNPTNGMIYKHTESFWNPAFTLKSGLGDDYMKFEGKGGSPPWDITKYLNIWVCDAGELNGFTNFPSIPLDGLRDGIVISWNAFGIKGNNHPLSNFGRTLPHEIGHWLGLRHIWGDDDSKETDVEFCEVDDGIDDTPKQPKRSDNGRLRSFSNFKLPDCNNSPAGCMWMNYMDYVPHLNRIMFTQGQVNKARTVLKDPRRSLLESPGLKPPQHGTGTFEAFRTNAFTTVAVGKDGHIWAGTVKFGLYKYDFNTWTEVTALANRDIRQIVPDRNGSIWIAQSGYEGLRGIGGGLNYFENGNTNKLSYITPNKDNLPSRICEGVYIDTNIALPGYNVWTAHSPEININTNTQPVFESGGIGFKTYDGAFQKITAGLSTSLYGVGTRVVKAIQGNASEVWAFDDGIVGQPQIVRYQPSTRQVINPSFNATNTDGYLPESFIVNCFYFDTQGNKWVGLEIGGVAYADATNIWHKLTLPETLSTDVAIHAITADKAGNFFIGTSEGLLVTRFSDIMDPAKFKLMRIEDDIPSDNITALAVHEERGLLIVATDNGMTFLTKDCLLQPCIATVPPVYYSTKSGNWNDPTVWSHGQVPECGSIVVIMDHTITAVSKSQATSVHLVGSTLKVEKGVQFVLCEL